MVKKQLKITIDPNIVDVLTDHCCDINLSRSKYISKLIADDLHLTLDTAYNMYVNTYNEQMLRIIDSKISQLKSKREKYIKEEEGGVMNG